MPGFSRSWRMEEGRVRLFYGKEHMDCMNIAHAFALQKNSEVALELLGENVRKRYRTGGSYAVSGSSTQKMLEQTPVRQKVKAEPEATDKSEQKEDSPPPRSDVTLIPASQPRSPWLAKDAQERLRKMLRKRKTGET